MPRGEADGRVLRLTAAPHSSAPEVDNGSGGGIIFVLAQANPGPDLLVQDGALLPVTVSVPGGPSRNVTAQVDLGSTISSVDRSVLAALGAPQIGTVEVQTVTDVQQVLLYGAALSSGPTQLLPAEAGVLGDDIQGRTKALLGRDALQYAGALLDYDAAAGSWTLQVGGQAPAPSGAPWWVLGASVAVLGVGAALVAHAEYRKGERLGRREAAALILRRVA